MTEKMEETIITELFKLSEKFDKMQDDIKNMKENMATKKELADLEKRMDERFEEQARQIDEKLDKRFVEQDKKIEARFAEQDKKIEARFAEQDKKIEARFAEQDKKIEARFAEQDKKIEEKFVEQSKQFDKKLKEGLDKQAKEISAEFHNSYMLNSKYRKQMKTEILEIVDEKIANLRIVSV